MNFCLATLLGNVHLGALVWGTFALELATGSSCVIEDPMLVTPVGKETCWWVHDIAIKHKPIAGCYGDADSVKSFNETWFSKKWGDRKYIFEKTIGDIPGISFSAKK